MIPRRKSSLRQPKIGYKKQIRQLAMALPHEKRQEILSDFKAGMIIKDAIVKYGLDEDTIFGVIWINMKKVTVLREVSV